MTQILPPPIIPIGRITSKHGYKGSLNIFWDDDDLIPEPGDYLYVLINEKGVPFLIEEMSKSLEIVKLQFVDSESKAEELLGLTIGLDQNTIDEVPPQFQINGFQLISSDEQIIGIIDSLEDYPGQIMMNIICENRKILIPFVEDWIIQIDEKNRTLQMDLPEGLVDPESYED
jgi:16S rRNA processing protein RimM